MKEEIANTHSNEGRAQFIYSNGIFKIDACMCNQCKMHLVDAYCAS